MPDSPVLKKSRGSNCMIAERLSARLLIVQQKVSKVSCEYLSDSFSFALLSSDAVPFVSVFAL